MGRKSAVPEFVIENHESIRLDAIRLKHPEIGRPHSKPGWSINEFVGFRFALPNLLDWLIDEGRPDYTLAVMAKYFSGQSAVFCANVAVEIHGGYGYIDEYDVSKYYRDAKILEIYEGTKEAEVMTIGRVLIGK